MTVTMTTGDTTMERVRVGVIGLGEIGRAHCEAVRSLPQAELVAVADVDEALAGRVAAETGATGHTDHRRLLAQPGLDAVIVATPDQLHRDIVLDAAAAGVHILVEKPIATTLADAEAMSAACDAAGVLLMVGFTLRFFPQYVLARDAVTRGELGRAVSAFARRTNLTTQSARLGGRTGVLFFLAIHDFDVLCWILGSTPTRIYCAQSTSVPGPHPVEDETFTTIGFDDGSIACVHAGWRLPVSHPAGFDFRLDLTGSEGVLNLGMEHQGVTVIGAGGTRYPAFVDALVREDRAFVDAVRTGGPSPVPAADGITALRMVLAAEESLRTGLSVTLDA